MKTSPLPLRPVSLAIALVFAITAAHAAKPTPPDPDRSETAAVTVDIQPAGGAEPGAYIKRDEDVARTGERPRAGAAEVVTVLAPIRAIDTKNNTITVEGPRGNVVTLDVRKPEHQARLGQLKVGDMLRVAFTEAAAVQVRAKGR